MIRQAGPQDVRFLRDMLRHAYHWRLNEDPDLPVARYVNNWGRPGDAGLVAWENGPIGAAWYRFFPADAPGFGFVDEPARERARRRPDACAPRPRARAGSQVDQPQRGEGDDRVVRALRLPASRREGRDGHHEGGPLKGLELSRRFYFEAVRPILDHSFPDLDHAAARIHFGSEVLGFDDEMSRDHYWGPRIQLFLRDLSRAGELNECLARELPTDFAGFPTHFGRTEEAGMVGMKSVTSGPVDHRAETLVLRDYVRFWLGLNPLEGFTTVDWLVTPSQKLLEWTAGEMFYDSIGELTRLRELLAWYPEDVWLFVMAGHWGQIGEL